MGTHGKLGGDDSKGDFDKYLCLFCNKDFSNFETHARAKHPEFYQIQLKFEMGVFPARQLEIEELDPLIKQIPRGTVKQGPMVIRASLHPIKPSRTRAVTTPSTRSDVVIDPLEYTDAMEWERMKFPRTALACLAQATDALFDGKEINRRQLEVIYQTAINNFTSVRIYSMPSTLGFAAVRDQYDELLRVWQNRLISHEKEQAILAAGGFTCPSCGVSYKSKSALSTHVRKIHPQDYIRQIIAQERASPSTSKEGQDYMIARQKFEIFLSHGQLNEALEQLRIGVLKLKEEYDRLMSALIITNLDTRQQMSMNETQQELTKHFQFAMTPQGLEQARKELSKWKGREYSIEEARQVITKLSQVTKETSHKGDTNKRQFYQFFIDRARVLFKKHYKDQEIPQEIQHELDSL